MFAFSLVLLLLLLPFTKRLIQHEKITDLNYQIFEARKHFRHISFDFGHVYTPQPTKINKFTFNSRRLASFFFCFSIFKNHARLDAIFSQHAQCLTCAMPTNTQTEQSLLFIFGIYLWYLEMTPSDWTGLGLLDLWRTNASKLNPWLKRLHTHTHSHKHNSEWHYGRQDEKRKRHRTCLCVCVARGCACACAVSRYKTMRTTIGRSKAKRAKTQWHFK